MPHELPKQRQHPAWAVPAKASLSAAKQAVSARQLLEQGMHGLQGSLLRLKDHFIYEETSKRKLALQSAMPLHNFCASLDALRAVALTAL